MEARLRPESPAPPLSLMGRARPAPETSPWALPWSAPDHSLQNRMHYRYYGNTLGRFMRPDNVNGNPMNPQSWNLYSYVHGNPVNFNDPTGHGTPDTEQQSTQNKVVGGMATGGGTIGGVSVQGADAVNKKAEGQGGIIEKVATWVKQAWIAGLKAITGSGPPENKNSAASQAKDLQKEGLAGEVGTEGTRTDVGNKVNSTIQQTTGTIVAEGTKIVVGAAVDKGAGVVIEALPPAAGTLIKGAQAMQGIVDKQKAATAVGQAAAGQPEKDTTGQGQ